jgi:hypothetical protein
LLAISVISTRGAWDPDASAVDRLHPTFEIKWFFYSQIFWFLDQKKFFLFKTT